MVNVLGLDIGGANTKAAYIKADNGYVTECKTAIEYFPVWKNPEKLSSLLSKISKTVIGSAKLDSMGVTMTAELSDAYTSKREGVIQILENVVKSFPALEIFVLDVNGNLKSVTEAFLMPTMVAAANWVATGWLVSQLVTNCVVIDIGSTSTSIIPVLDGKVSAAGKTDLEKLVNGELVYTGSLRTNIATIVNSLPIRGGIARVSSELFAQSADIHLVLGNITEQEYTVETTDKRGKTRIEALARLARVVCSDNEMLTEKEIVAFSKYIYNAQIQQISEGLKQVYSRIEENANMKVTAVVTGLGKNFLARKAAQLIGIAKITDLGELLPSNVTIGSPAVGVALMVATKIEGKKTLWKQ